MDQKPPLPSSLPSSYLTEDTSGHVIAATTVILIMTTVLLGLRLYARTLTPAKHGWDEYLLVLSYLLLLGLFTCIYMEVLQAGLGRHTVVVLHEDPSKAQLFFKILYILDWFYLPSNALSRISVVLFYLRVFTNKLARAAAWAVIAFLAANGLAAVIAASLECKPLEYAWNKTIDGSCFDQMLWYQLINIPNVVGDIMIMLLPIRTIWDLKASNSRKLGIATVCLTGSIGLIASCVRTSIFFESAEFIETDQFFTESAFTWTVVEGGMYFCAACLIGLRPLLNRVSKGLRSHVGRSKPGKSDSGADNRLSSTRSITQPEDQQSFARKGAIPLLLLPDGKPIDMLRYDFDEESLSKPYPTYQTPYQYHAVGLGSRSESLATTV